MSRPLKFRAWCENLQYYFYDVAIYPNGVVARKSNALPDMLTEGETHWHELDNAVIEQFTGLWDINGKEIYEGDIIRQTWFNGDDGDIAIIGVVGFDEEEASFGIVQTIRRTDEQYSGFYSQREVIGNIHENPELLKVE